MFPRSPEPTPIDVGISHVTPLGPKVYFIKYSQENKHTKYASPDTSPCYL